MFVAMKMSMMMQLRLQSGDAHYRLMFMVMVLSDDACGDGTDDSSATTVPKCLLPTFVGNDDASNTLVRKCSLPTYLRCGGRNGCDNDEASKTLVRKFSLQIHVGSGDDNINDDYDEDKEEEEKEDDDAGENNLGALRFNIFSGLKAHYSLMVMMIVMQVKTMQQH